MTPEARQQITQDCERDDAHALDQERTLVRADLDEAPCAICGELESKSCMEWLSNALGEQGWVCAECSAESEAS